MLKRKALGIGHWALGIGHRALVAGPENTATSAGALVAFSFVEFDRQESAAAAEEDIVEGAGDVAGGGLSGGIAVTDASEVLEVEAVVDPSVGRNVLALARAFVAPARVDAIGAGGVDDVVAAAVGGEDVPDVESRGHCGGLGIGGIAEE